jgi:sigma-E factor negative regulatory protein RseB
MIRRMLALAVVAAALPWAVAPLASPAAAPRADTATATQLVERVREAPQQYDFAGTVAVGWRSGSRMVATTVDVTALGGTVEIENGSRRVIDVGGHTYVLGESGWDSVLMTPETATIPSPDHAWDLTTRPGPTIAGRPTTEVVASRPGRGVAARLYVDTQTGLLLGREVLDASGRVRRSVQFTTITVGATQAVDQPRARPKDAARLRSLPDGYRAPAQLGGYELVGRGRQPGGGVQLVYSDGLFTATVYEQRGQLDWSDLAAGGSHETIAGHDVRRYTEPGADVVVWEKDGIVYTCVIDAPRDATASVIADLAPAGRSTIDKAVDFVIGPMHWN